MPSGQSGPPAVRKHLMTPGQPRPPQRYNTDLTSVQRWVMSSLAGVTIMHMSAGIVVAACFSDEVSSQWGLLAIGAAFGLIAIAAARMIHRRNPLSPWLLLGFLPAAVGAYFLLR